MQTRVRPLLLLHLLYLLLQLFFYIPLLECRLLLPHLFDLFIPSCLSTFSRLLIAIFDSFETGDLLLALGPVNFLNRLLIGTGGSVFFFLIIKGDFIPPLLLFIFLFAYFLIFSLFDLFRHGFGLVDNIEAGTDKVIDGQLVDILLPQR